MLKPILAALLFLLASCVSPTTSAPSLIAPDQLLTGEPLQVSARGLRPGETVTLIGTRDMEKWEQSADGAWARRRVIVQAWATFRADRRGAIDANNAPLAGTWSNADARGLLWSGFPAGAPELNGHQAPDLPRPAANQMLVALVRGDAVLSTHSITLNYFAAGVRSEIVAEPGLSGAFALPPMPGRYPVVVLLHGSEGGSRSSAEAQARRFASRGFAALAINYFAWPHEAIPGVSQVHINTPIEMIATARDWLAHQPEVDVERFALYGVSKGAEFTASAAARYTWIDAAIPCVGSDMVWEGYGRDPIPGEQMSSWSWQGQPLPYVHVPLPDYQRWPINTQRYEEALAQLGPAEIEAARIPVERSNAAFLIIGGDRDEVWASGRMSRNLEQRLRTHSPARIVETAIYPMAGHQICGDGNFPIRLYSVQRTEPDAKDLEAEGIATVDAWERTIRFLHDVLDAE